jgi:predicted SnoaL-like aldol condensation-catalyzing enzyme
MYAPIGILARFANKRPFIALTGFTLVGAVLLLLVAMPSLPTEAAGKSTSEFNKRNVVEFYERGLGQKDFDAAKKFFGPKYTQHNPNAPDGIEGVKIFIQFLKQKYPNYELRIKRVFADSDYVILHVHGVFEPGTRGKAIVDIFRLEDGKIVEHWDVAQDIPASAANTNSMF